MIGGKCGSALDGANDGRPRGDLLERDGFEPSVRIPRHVVAIRSGLSRTWLMPRELQTRSDSDDRRSRLRRPPRRQNRKVLARLVESGDFACGRLKTTDDHIDIERVEFEPAANTPRLVRGDERGARTQERVKDNIPAMGEVDSASSIMAAGLTGRMLLKSATGVRAQRPSSGIGPDVGAPTAALAQLDIVHVSLDPLLEQGKQFMLRAIKTSHSGVGLGPHDEIERRQRKLGRRRMDDGQSPPIDERAENAAVAEPIDGGPATPAFMAPVAPSSTVAPAALGSRLLGEAGRTGGDILVTA